MLIKSLERFIDLCKQIEFLEIRFFEKVPHLLQSNKCVALSLESASVAFQHIRELAFEERMNKA